MNRKMVVEFLIGNGFFALRVNNRYFGMVPVKDTLEPVYLRIK